MPEQLEDETGGNFYNPSQGLFNMTDLPSQYSALAGDNLVAQPHKVGAQGSLVAATAVKC